MSGNGLTTVPNQIGNLANLEILDLANNQIMDLPASVRNLQKLSHLLLSGNRFRNISPPLQFLGNLTFLDMRNSPNAAPDVPGYSEVVQRIAVSRTLRTLRLPPNFDGQANGRIVGVPPWLFEALAQLEWLYLDGNDIEDLPGTTSKLQRLKGIFLGENHIGSFPSALTRLPQLEYLDLHANRLSSISREINDMVGLKSLDLNDNPLPIPPEILARKNEPRVVIDFIIQIASRYRALDEAKVLVVGEGSVGKTSLIKRLVRDQFNRHEAKTEGIDITRWRVASATAETMNLNVWDFGGQEIMHATHQFFLTKRSIYVIVIDARQDDEQNHLEYWLKLVQGFSGGSPVIIVGNKNDEAPLDIDNRGLRAKYPDIAQVVSASSKDGNGISDLKDALAKAAFDLAHVKDVVPEAFFLVKAEIERLDLDFLPFADFQRLCRSRGVVELPTQEVLVRFLHDLGTVLCFRDDPRLAGTNILNPSWVTGGVYRILNSNEAAQKKGLLTLIDIDTILNTPDYPPEKRLLIADMMRRFELCYEADNILLVPDLLTKEEPDTGSWDGALRFAIKYDVLPSSVMSRLIVRMNSLISMKTVWRSGVVLTLDGNRALVKADRADGILSIQVLGTGPGRRGMLTAIRSEVRAIATTIPGIVAEELVPVREYQNVWVPYSHLLELESSGFETVIPQGLIQQIRIQELLDGVEARTERSVAAIDASEGATAPEDRTALAAGSSWTPRQAISFTVVLAACVIALTAAAVLVYKFTGNSSLAIFGIVTVTVISLGLFALRASGRLSESGFSSLLKEVFSRTKGD